MYKECYVSFYTNCQELYLIQKQFFVSPLKDFFLILNRMLRFSNKAFDIYYLSNLKEN